MADTAVRYGPVAGTGSVVTLYTATTNGAILRQIHIANTTTTDQTFNMSIGIDTAGTRIFSGTAVPAGGVYDWQGFIPLADTETLRWNAPSTLTVTCGFIAQ